MNVKESPCLDRRWRHLIEGRWQYLTAGYKVDYFGQELDSISPPPSSPSTPSSSPSLLGGAFTHHSLV